MMNERQYNELKKGVKIYNELKGVLPNRGCIETVIKTINRLDDVDRVVEMPYEILDRYEATVCNAINQYKSMEVCEGTCRPTSFLYMESNGEIATDEPLKDMILGLDYLSIDREQYIAFILSKDSVTLEGKEYKKGSLVIVKHPARSGLTVYEKNIAKLRGIEL